MTRVVKVRTGGTTVIAEVLRVTETDAVVRTYGGIEYKVPIEGLETVRGRPFDAETFTEAA